MALGSVKRNYHKVALRALKSNRGRKLNIEVAISRFVSPTRRGAATGYYDARACIRGSEARRYRGSPLPARCSLLKAGRTPTEAIRKAVIDLGRRLPKK